MGQRSAVPGQGQGLAAVEPAPTYRASNELIDVVHAFANGKTIRDKAVSDKAVSDTAAAVGHLRLRPLRRCALPIGAADIHD